METIKISKNSLSLIGANSLEGWIFTQFGSIPKELRIEFEQSTLEWKQKNKGPDEIIVPEHVPMVLCESILYLSKKCNKLEIGEYQE
jgi:hypothetical protein